MHTKNKLRRAVTLFLTAGHRETPELDFGLHTRLVALPFLSYLSLHIRGGRLRARDPADLNRVVSESLVPGS